MGQILANLEQISVRMAILETNSIKAKAKRTTAQSSENNVDNEVDQTGEPAAKLPLPAKLRQATTQNRITACWTKSTGFKAEVIKIFE